MQGQTEVIIFKDVNYPFYCSQCGKRIKVEALVFPPTEAIFCGTTCASNWFASHCEKIFVVYSERGDEDVCETDQLASK